MALTNLANTRQTRQRIAAAPEAFQLTVLAAVNPPMAAVLEDIENNPEKTVAALKKLDLSSAEEVVSLCRSHATLREALSDTRDGVTGAARSRASDLGINLSEVPRTERSAADPTKTAESRTQKLIAKGFDDVVKGLPKMATIDRDVVLAWVETLPLGTDWSALLVASGRHWGMDDEIMRIATTNETVEVEALWADDTHKRTLINAVQGSTKDLTVTQVRIVEMALAEGMNVSETQTAGLTPAAREYVANGTVLLRHLCRAAEPQEIVDELFKNIAEHLASPDRYTDALSRVEILLANSKTPEVVAVLAPRLEGIFDELDQDAWRISRSIPHQFIKVEGLPRETVHVLWPLIGNSTKDILLGELGPVPNEEELDMLVAMFAAGETKNFNPDDALRPIAWMDNLDGAVALFLEKLLMQTPGGANRLLGATSYWRGSPFTSLVMEKAAEVLGHNQAAWNVFMEQVDGHQGLFTDLLNAAVIATS
jgi:hypothetical protein